MASVSKRAPLPGAVLFACNFNRVRSPMAEALLKRALGDRVYVDSCGLKQEPGEAGEGADPFVRSVMEEISVDLANHAPKTFDPTLAEGSREARLAAYREVRDHLAKRIAERFPR